MTDRNANRPGYKQTKVGWIPEEWEVKNLASSSRVIMGQSPDSKFYNEEGEGLPLIQGMSDVKNGKTKPRYWTTQITKECQPDDIILSVRAPVGSLARAIHHACIGRGVCAIRSKKSPDFTFQLLQYMQPIWARYSQGSTFEAVVSKDVKQFPVPNPPLAEQQKIAEILSTWDRAIEQTQKLINAKQRLKKGLMQQLLTGRMRFPGFGAPVEKKGELPEGWEKHQMSNVINILGGGTPARKEEHFWHGDIPWLAVGDFSDVTRYVHDSEEKITEEGLGNSNTRILEKGAVIISARGTVGAIAQLARPMAFNQTSYGLIGKEKYITNDYLFYFLKNNIQLFAGVKYGAVFDTITKDTFKYIVIKVPELIEQIRISNMLSTIDKEIDLLHNQIIFLSKQKFGLMQKLLSGAIITKNI